MQFVRRFLLLLSSAFCLCADVTVSGKVIDSLTGVPVDGVEIQINIRDAAHVLSANEGTFSITGPLASGRSCP